MKPPTLDPDIPTLARRRAQVLREQAINDAFARLRRLLRPGRRTLPTSKEQPCHS